MPIISHGANIADGGARVVIHSTPLPLRSYETGEEPVLDIRSVSFPLGPKALLELPIFGEYTTLGHGHGPDPPDCAYNSRAERAENALDSEAARGEVGESNADDEEHGSRIGRVADNAIWARADEFVFRMDGQVEGEELAEFLEAADAYARADHDQDDAAEEHEREWVLGTSGRKECGIEVCGEGGGEGRPGVVVECRDGLEGGDPPECDGVKFEDERCDLQEEGLLGVVAELFRGLVGRRAGSLVECGLDEDERSTPEDGQGHGGRGRGWGVGAGRDGFLWCNPGPRAGRGSPHWKGNPRMGFDLGAGVRGWGQSLGDAIAPLFWNAMVFRMSADPVSSPHDDTRIHGERASAGSVPLDSSSD